jgi:hypothetical protein
MTRFIGKLKPISLQRLLRVVASLKFPSHCAGNIKTNIKRTANVNESMEQELAIF